MTSFVNVQPQLLTTTAVDAAGLGSAIDSAAAAAALPTTSLAVAAGDGVSLAAATVFNDFGIQYQAVLRELGTVHDKFVAALTAAGTAFTQAEAGIATTLGLGGAGAANPILTAVSRNGGTQAVTDILIMTGSGTATPTATYMNAVSGLFLKGFTGPTTTGLSTPEGLYPFTGVKDLTLDISLARGVTILDNAIKGVLGTGPTSNSVAVLGYSQSAILASMEMPKLLAEGYTKANAFFTLIGDPANPNGGLFARFPNLTMPSLGVTFGGSTPSNDFPTTIWTREYDGFADFPQYPINLLSDVNALAGIVFIHGHYPTLTPTQLNSAVVLQQSGAPSLTQYNMIPTADLPILTPLRAIPFIGKPLADLIQPDLRYLINWGYGDINYGWSTSPANIDTPFGVLPPWETTGAILGPALIHGAQQGFNAFAADIAAQIPTSAPTLPTLPNLFGGGTGSGAGLAPMVPTLDTIIAGLQNANTSLSTTLVGDVSTAYATLLPTADLALALGVTLPSYNVNLFLNGVQQIFNGDPIGGLVNAIGQPLASDIGLGTLAAGFQLISVENSLQTILTGVPNPGPY